MEQSLAGRFAAKEALLKGFRQAVAFTTSRFLSQAGRPFIMFHGNRYDEVSISTEKSYAVSVVIREDVKKGDA